MYTVTARGPKRTPCTRIRNVYIAIHREAYPTLLFNIPPVCVILTSASLFFLWGLLSDYLLVISWPYPQPKAKHSRRRSCFPAAAIGLSPYCCVVVARLHRCLLICISLYNKRRVTMMLRLTRTL